MTTSILLDKPRHLRYTANAVADIEEVMDCGLNTLLSTSTKMGIRHARAFLWGGLKHEDRRLQAPGGLERAGDLIEVWYANRGTLDSLYVKIIEALKEDGWLKPMTAEDKKQIEDDMGEVMGLEDTGADLTP